MFFLEFALAVFSYIVAKSIWHFVVLPTYNDANTYNKWMFRLADALIAFFAAAFLLGVAAIVGVVLLYMVTR